MDPLLLFCYIYLISGIFYAVFFSADLAALASFSLASSLRFLIAPVGQTLAHMPQFLHFSGSIKARLSVTCTASNLQTLSHFLQPMQPTSHALRVTAPLSLLWQWHITMLLAGEMRMSD